VNEKRQAAAGLPTDPETNSRYSHLNQLNHKWWQQAAILAETQANQTGGVLTITDNCIKMPWFNRIVNIQPATKSMTYLNDNHSQPGYQDGLVILALLNYLTVHQQLPPDTELINENHLTGGTTFFRGPHLMASVILAQRFGNQREEFIKRAQLWGGQSADYGDSGIKFEIFPGLNWIVALWQGDNEFPARAQYLFDRKLDQLFQLDIIWALGNLVAAKFRSIRATIDVGSFAIK